MGLSKVQKEERDGNTRRLCCCREVVVKKMGRLLDFCCLTMQKMQSSLPDFLYHDFSAAAQSSYVLIPSLFLCFLRACPYLQLNFIEKMLPLVFICTILLGMNTCPMIVLLLHVVPSECCLWLSLKSAGSGVLTTVTLRPHAYVKYQYFTYVV